VAVVIDSVGLLEVGAAAAVAGHVSARPVSYGVGYGHYIASSRFTLVGNQLANSQLVSFRNGGPNLCIPLRFRVKLFQMNSTTGNFLFQLQLSKLVSFTLSASGASTVTPSYITKRTPPSDWPGGPSADLRALVVAGTSGGMAGAQFVEEAGKLAIADLMVTTTSPAGQPGYLGTATELLDDVNGTHPLVLGENEGILLRSQESGVTSATLTLAWWLDWVETRAY
jgi:hypothetical protein